VSYEENKGGAEMDTRLIAMIFDSENEASAVLDDLRKIARRGHLHLTDTAIVRKDADGKTHVKNEVSTGTEVGAVTGALAGGLLFLMVPVVGQIAGVAIGGWLGSRANTGVETALVKEVTVTLQPGQSALFLIVSSGDPDAVLATLQGRHGHVYQTTLRPEVEAALRKTLEGPTQL
jgi:uncharacterized membrane protein